MDGVILTVRMKINRGWETETTNKGTIKTTQSWHYADAKVYLSAPNCRCVQPLELEQYFVELVRARRICTVPELLGVLKIPHGALDGVMEGKAMGGLEFLPVPGGPNGVVYDAAGDTLYIVTCGGDDPDNGAVFKVAKSAFSAGKLPALLVRNLTAADGIVKTAKGALVVSLFNGNLVEVSESGFVKNIRLQPHAVFAQPSDLKLMKLADGTELLLMPEQGPKATESWKQSLYVIRL